MSGSSHYAARIVKELGKSGEPVFSSGMQNCPLVDERVAKQEEGDYYSIPQGPACIQSTGVDIYRSAFSEINKYFFNRRSFAEQLEEFYNSEDIKKQLGIDSTKSFATFKEDARSNKEHLIALVRLFFETEKLDPKLVDFLMNGLNQNGFLEGLATPLFTIFDENKLILAPVKGDASSQERKYEIFVGAEGKEVEIFQSYNINKVLLFANPDEFVKKEVKTVAHIKASVDANGTISASMEYHASASKEDRKYAAKTIQKVTPEGQEPVILCSDAVRQAVSAKDLITLNKLLQNSYLNLDVQDKNGKTALHYAAEANSPDMVLALVDAGANVLIKDKEGKMAVDCSNPHSSSNIHVYLHKLTHTEFYLARQNGKKEKTALTERKIDILTDIKGCLVLAATNNSCSEINTRLSSFDNKVMEKRKEVAKGENSTLVTWFARLVSDLNNFIKSNKTSDDSAEKTTSTKASILSPKRGESHGEAFIKKVMPNKTSFWESKSDWESKSERFDVSDPHIQSSAVDIISMTVGK